MYVHLSETILVQHTCTVTILHVYTFRQWIVITLFPNQPKYIYV